jgi:flagellar basal-body rod modification protein FlgD
MTMITPLNANVNANALTPTPGKSAQTLDQNAFLRLMTTQLKEQDPFDPVDNGCADGPVFERRGHW